MADGQRERLEFGLTAELDPANAIEVSAADFNWFVTELDKPDEAVPELVKLFSHKSRIPKG